MQQQEPSTLHGALSGSGNRGEAPRSKKARHPWAWLLKRVFAIDVTVCARCHGRMRIIEVALSADAIARVLARHGKGPQPPPAPPKPVPGQLVLPGVPIH